MHFLFAERLKHVKFGCTQIVYVMIVIYFHLLLGNLMVYFHIKMTNINVSACENEAYTEAL